MANVYGTKEYEEYIEKYRKSIVGYEFVKTDKTEEHFEINGIRFDIVTFDNHVYQNETAPYPWYHTLFHEITITLKNGKKNTYNTIEACCKPQVFNYQGIDYIFISKTLYGYCIINSRDFDEYNYFPSEVLQEGEEAFICCNVYCLRDLLLIVGCYWAYPYEIYVLDLESKKVVRLNDCLEFKGLADYDIGGSSIKVYKNGFGVTSKENEKEYLLDYSNLKNWIDQDGTFDL